MPSCLYRQFSTIQNGRLKIEESATGRTGSGC